MAFKLQPTLGDKSSNPFIDITKDRAEVMDSKRLVFK